MPAQHYTSEPTIATKAQALQGVDNTIADAVGNGRLFVLNGAGEMEQVELFTYWRDGNLYTVVSSRKYEVDEDGDVTRDWGDKRTVTPMECPRCGEEEYQRTDGGWRCLWCKHEWQ